MGFRMVCGGFVDDKFLTYEYLRDNNLFCKQLRVIHSNEVCIKNIQTKIAIFGHNTDLMIQLLDHTGILILDDMKTKYVQKRK